MTSSVETFAKNMGLTAYMDAMQVLKNKPAISTSANNSNSIFASSPVAKTDSKITGEVNSNTGTTSVGENYNVTNSSNVTAESLNKQLKGKLAGEGQAFIDAGKQYGIDPAFLAAIAMFESGGTSNAIKTYNNCSGVMDPENPKEFLPYDSVGDSINDTAKRLKENYIDKGLLTISQIQQKYCPVGADNDVNGTNGDWLPGVTSLTKKYANGVNLTA